MPAVRIGRLAVHRTYQGRGLGAAVLMDAVQRIAQGAAAAFAMLVDAKDDEAVAFYRRNEFRAVIGRPRTLFLPIATMQQAFPRKRAT